MADQQILDAIHNKSYQYAKSLIKVKQQRNPNHTYYKVLEVYVSYLTGEQNALQEIVKLVSKVNDLGSTDILFEVLISEGKEKEANEVYENIVKFYPNNCKPFLTQWFENSIKFRSLKSLQKLCFNLNKVDPNPYQAAFANYLLANDSGNALFYKLGYKFIESLLPKTTQELFVFVKVLQDEPNKALEYIEKFPKNLDLDTKLIYLDLLKSLEQYDKLFTVCHSYLFDDKFNDFDTWKLYILAGSKLTKSFEDLKKEITSYAWSRNTELALIELAKVYDHADFDKYIVDYYNKFNKKLCCFYDLRSYTTSHEPLVEAIKESSKSVLQEPVSISNLNIVVNNQKLLQYFNQVDDEYYSLNWTIYKYFLPLVKDKVDTDFYIANDLILINVLHSLNENFTSENILLNIVILKHLLMNDPLDFKVNLWLLKLSKLMNLNEESFKIYDTLKIKMIQNDSLGYLLIQSLANSTGNATKIEYLINIFRFYLTFESDLNTNVVSGFQNKVYNRLENFIKFEEKFKNSVLYYELLLEIYKLIKINGSKKYEGYFTNRFSSMVKTIENANLKDNRDTKIFYKDFAFSLNFVSSLESKFGQLSIYGNKENQFSYLKLKYLREALILKFDETTYKKYNKLSAKVNFNKFDGWLHKVYLSLFKLNLKLNKSEYDSCINYLTKNLKLNKVPLTDNGQIFQTNFELISILELTQYSAKFKQLATVNKNLVNEIDDTPKQKIFDQLDTIKAKLQSDDFEIDVSKDFIQSQFDIFHDDLAKSSYMHCK